MTIEEIAPVVLERIYRFEGLPGKWAIEGSSLTMGLLLSLALERACEMVQEGEENGQAALELVAIATLSAIEVPE